MRNIPPQLIILVSLMWLSSCESIPVQMEIFSTATDTPQARQIATKVSSESSSEQQKIAIGDARFSSKYITVEIPAIAAADFNNDGYQDLVGGGVPQLTIFLGEGDGEFTRFSQVPGGEQPDEFALADLDEDGDVDIVVANHDTDYLTILLGDGYGKFQPASNSPLQINVSPHPHVVRAEDLDGNGHIDLVIDNRDAEGVLILPGLGQGRFKSPGILVEVGGDPYRGMALGDINGDERLDLVTPNPSEVGVLINTSNGEIGFAQGSPIDAEAPFAVELGDFNGDGKLDLIAASDEGSSLVELFLGDGRGGFKVAEDSPYHLAPGGKSIIVGDFNGDDIDDAVVASYHHPEVLVLFGGHESTYTDFIHGGEHPWGLAAADFNLDGKDDIVVGDDASHTATIYLSIDQ